MKTILKPKRKDVFLLKDELRSVKGRKLDHVRESVAYNSTGALVAAGNPVFEAVV